VRLREQAIRAAETVLTQCLDLPVGAEIVVFGDEMTIDVAGILAQVAVKLELEPILTYFTRQMQMDLGGKELAPALDTVLKDAAAALICLNDTPECFLFRDNVRQTAWNAGCRVAHMPGINQSTLLLADVDYEALSAQCEMLALALAKGRQLEITSWDHKGNEHCLQTTLQPWMRLPIISDGLIQKRAWGNVPSGETYIAPPEGLTEGTIVINGSIQGYQIGPGEEVILRFHKGRLVEWSPHKSPATKHLQRTEIDFARSQGDQNWSNLAEIGLGANPRVRELTGNPLLDEKKYGSVHIALGNNIDMGGEVQSCIHCSMVCLSPKVSIDGKTVIKGDKIVLKSQDWCEDYREIRPPEAWGSDLCIKHTATGTHVDGQGRLKRLWDTSSGRVCSVSVGNDETARMAANIYQLLQRRRHSITTVRELTYPRRRIALPQLLQLIYVLKLYGLVKIHNGKV